MSARQAPAMALAGAIHPAVLDRRVRELVLGLASALVALAIGLVVAIVVPNPNIVLTLAVIIGALALVVLIASSRLEVTVTVLAVYLGLLDGPVKLLSSGGTVTSGIQDVLIVGVAAGAVLRLVVKRERITLPPLCAWVLGFVVLVLVEAFNPQTNGALKVLGGVRQELQYVPFFFFGYVLLRSKSRFRKMFIILGVLALANGIVSTYQTRLSPGQLASWGPGYRQRIYGQQIEGKKKGGGRLYVSEGQARVRPPALGSDAGFGGGVGLIALPGTLALIALWRGRRRWLIVVLCFGALLAVATCLGRIQVVGAAVGVLAFAGLSASLGRRMTRPVIVLLTVGLLALPIGAIFVAYEGAGTFKRYESIAPEHITAGGTVGHKSGSLSLLPHQIAVAPFGVGLGSVGAVSGFGGRSTELLEGHTVSADTQFNLTLDELGLPGMIMWTLFTLQVILLAVRRLRRIEDVELRLALAAVTAPLVSVFAMGFSGPTIVSAAAGPYEFFAAGAIAYWFAGPGFRLARGRAPRPDRWPAPTLTARAGGLA